MDTSQPHTIVVVSHTHWDREWYHPLGRMRQRLVRLIDGVLDAPDGLPFLLDGQAIALDDYLAARPEREHTLRESLRDGRLEAGPWYVLADMLLPGGEALVRNLLEGTRRVRELGGNPPDVLYSPDAFGHAAAGPALAEGFGLGVAIVWRGFGGMQHPRSTVAWWRHASGARVLLYHLPPDGYEIGSSLPVAQETLAARWHAMRDAVLGTNPLRIALLPNGADHHARQAHRRAALTLLAGIAAPHGVEPDTLSGFAARLRRAAEAATLFEVSGELRDSAGWTWSLQGTFATRAHQKRTNAHVERLLVHDTEPWTALAWFTDAQQHASMRVAWKTLLATHPHDTLCGCSIDDVALAADQRWADARAQAIGLRDDALRALLHLDEATERDREPQWTPTLIVRNPSARARGGVASVHVLSDAVSDPVGPGSAAQDHAIRDREVASEASAHEAQLQVLDVSAVFDRVESPLHYPRNAVVRSSEALVWLDTMPGYALQPIVLRDIGALPSVPDAARVACTESTIRNAHWELALEVQGIVATNAQHQTFLYADGAIESITDAGDTYTPALRGDAVLATPSVPKLHHRGPLRASWRRTFSLERPRTSAATATSFAAEHAASAERVRIDTTVTYSLDAGADWFTIDIAGDNTACDHRLRWIQPLPVNLDRGTRAIADAAFGAVSRDAAAGASDWPAEQSLRTAPLHRWLWLQGERCSFGIVSDGLAEYEFVNDSIAITLVRAVGELSRRDLVERPGHAGWPAPTPLAQSLGPFAARLAIVVLPHDRDAALSRLQDVADAVLLPISGHTWRGVSSPLPTFAGLTLDGDGLVFSAAKRSEDGAWLVLRCVNQRASVVQGTWQLPRDASEARYARLDETPGEVLPVHGTQLLFEAPAFGIVTVLVR